MKKGMENEVKYNGTDINMVFKFLRENIGWIVAVSTAIISSFIALFAFLDHVKGITISNYFGFDISFYQTSDKYYILRSFLGAVCFYLILWFFSKKKKAKFFSAYNIKFSAFVIFLNFLLSIFYFSLVGLSTLVNAIIFYIFEWFFLKLCIPFFIKSMNQFDKKIDDDINYSLVKCIFSIIIYFFLAFIMFSITFVISTQSSLCNEKDYSIIDESRVIVHATSDYYVVMDCEINDGVLKLHQGKYEIIPVVNVHSEKVKFNDVKIK